jgi:FHS family L-fucose permease-like MFS transporter
MHRGVNNKPTITISTTFVPTKTMTEKTRSKFILQLTLITSLFFLWAFLHNINPILIPHLKKACQLTDTQSSFIDLSVYLGYFIVAIPAGLFTVKYGYKKGIILGLVLYALGAVLVIPSAGLRSYGSFLAAFFVIASGATILETVANPYVAVLGSKETAAQRLNFVQSFNGVGAFIAPILGGQFILTGIEYSQSQLSKMSLVEYNSYLQSEADTVKIPYLVIAGAVLLLIILFWVTPLPEVSEEDTKNHAPAGRLSLKVFKNTHFTWAVIAQFFYVGAQVGVGSFFIRYARFVAEVNEKSAAFMWGSFAMVGFMAGRFIGTFLMRYINPSRLLALYAGINTALMLAAVFFKGDVALYALIAVPFFMSIMYPTIFAFGIKNLGEDTKMGSSILVMSIIGGAVAPLFMGLISDQTESIQTAYCVPLICFVVILYYALNRYKAKTLLN